MTRTSRFLLPGVRGLAVAALAVALAPGSAHAQQQTQNPWAAQATAPQPQFAPTDPQAGMVPQAAPGSYAPQNLDQTLSGMKPPAPPPVVTVPGTPTTAQPAPLGTPSATAPPAAGAVVPPYAGVPLVGGYNYGYVPVPPVQPNTATIVSPYGGYPGTGYGYPGYGYPGTGYGYPGYGLSLIHI